MEKNIFDKWDNGTDLKGLKADIEASSNKTGNYVDVPHGDYEVKIKKMELVPTKTKGDPMVSVWFTVLAGEYKGQTIFMNQVVTQGFQLHIMDTFLKSLDTGVEITFDSYTQYAELLMDIAEQCDEQKLEYALRYEDNKGFDKFTITEVFEG